MQKVSNDYIVGLVDGEGSFYVRLNSDKKRRNKTEFKFSIKLRHQDKHILEEIKLILKCGNIYVQNDKRPNHSKCFRFEVNKKEDIENKIIPLFNNNPPRIQSRKRDFNIFKKILSLSKMFESNLEEIMSLKRQMHWGSLTTGRPFAKWGTSN